MSASDTTSDDGAERIAEPTVAEAVDSTESYEVAEGVVFYDADDPLAWIQSTRVVDLHESA